MSLVTKLVVVSFIVAGLAYWWGSNFNVPDGLEQKSEVLWVYGAFKIGKFLTEFGEKIGLGHRTHLMRKLEQLQFLESKKPIYNDIRTFRDSFGGVEVLIIEPKNKDAYGPALVWIHGGGWVIGSADSDIEFLEELSKIMKMMIVSIEYRMAPEYPYPIPLDDCVRATKYFLQNAAEHNVDPFRIAVGGMSAGGNLAAAVSLKIRDSDIMWKNKLQLLVVPCLQAYTFETPSYMENSLDDFLSRESMVNFWLWYALGPKGHILTDNFIESRHLQVVDPNRELHHLVDWKSLGLNSSSTFEISSLHSSSLPLSEEFKSMISKVKNVFIDPYYVPLMSTDLSGLPLTLIVAAEFDVLRDDALMYGKRLERHGVETKVTYYPGAFHHVLLWNDHYQLPKRVFAEIVEFLKVRL